MSGITNPPLGPMGPDSIALERTRAAFQAFADGAGDGSFRGENIHSEASLKNGTPAHEIASEVFREIAYLRGSALDDALAGIQQELSSPGNWSTIGGGPSDAEQGVMAQTLVDELRAAVGTADLERPVSGAVGG